MPCVHRHSSRPVLTPCAPGGREATHLVRVRARIRPRMRERIRARATVRARAGTGVRVSRSLPLEAVLDTLPLRPEVAHGGGAHLGRVRATARVTARVR